MKLSRKQLNIIEGYIISVDFNITKNIAICYDEECYGFTLVNDNFNAKQRCINFKNLETFLNKNESIKSKVIKFFEFNMEKKMALHITSTKAALYYADLLAEDVKLEICFDTKYESMTICYAKDGNYKFIVGLECTFRTRGEICGIIYQHRNDIIESGALYYHSASAMYKVDTEFARNQINKYKAGKVKLILDFNKEVSM